MPNRPGNPAPDAFRLIAEDGFAGAIGGIGQVIGSAGRHDITIVRRPGRITFDPSFNAGGDTIRLPGDAAEWRAGMIGSSASFQLLADNLRVIVPVGMSGAEIAFDDGLRVLRYHELEQAVKLGEQAIDAKPADVSAPPEAPPPLAQARKGPIARVIIQSGSTITLDGMFSVFGRADAPDSIEIGGGTILLDSSFNDWGNELRIHGLASDFTATLVDSSLRLVSRAIDLTVPVGLVANALVFDNSTLLGENGVPYEDTRELAFEEELGGVLLGGQTIGATPQVLTPFSEVAGKG